MGNFDALRVPLYDELGTSLRGNGTGFDRVNASRRLKLLISYDGTDLNGWQIQPNGPSVQSHLADAIERVIGQRIYPVGSGRTDAGVHAIAQVAHFDVLSRLSPHTLLRALNHFLPESIVIREIEEVPFNFHASKSAVRKLYRYVYNDSEVRDIFQRQFAWRVHYRLDERAMNEGASLILGTHDFRSFETEWPNRKSSVRTIYRCEVSRLGDNLILDIEANGFLYNMVRTIAGSLYEIGRGRWEPGRMKEIVDGGDRALAGQTAPPQGLFLVRVTYPDFSTGTEVPTLENADLEE